MSRQSATSALLLAALSTAFGHRGRVGRDAVVRGRAIGSPAALGSVDEQHCQSGLLLVVQGGRLT
jgi:hypothetical protein